MKFVKTLGIFLGATAIVAGCGGTKVVSETIGVTVTGLLPGTTLTLLDNGTDSLKITSNGTSTFATPIQAGNSYIVTIDTANPPVGQNCSVVNGIGLVEEALGSVTSVTVECVPSNIIVGGTISGLNSGATVTLENNGTELLTITGNGIGSQPFAFTKPATFGGSYSVVVSQQPANQNCTITPASGTITANSVPNLSVTCK